MATAARAMERKVNLPLSKSQKKKLRTGPILDVKKYIQTFTNKFCRQYEILHWQEDVFSECQMKHWQATQNRNMTKNGYTVAENMSDPPYAKRVIFNAAIQWEQRWRRENHHDDLDAIHETAPSPMPDLPEVSMDGLTDVESLICELHYGFGRGDGNSLSLIQIARHLKRSESFIRLRHAKALEILRDNMTKVTP